MKHPPRNIVIDWLNTLWSTELESNSKLVACNLRRYMNSQQDMAWPSVSRIAGECGLSQQCVRKHLKILCSEGWLVRQGTSNLETNIYQAAYPPAIIAPLQSISLPPAMVAAELNKELNNTTTTKGKPFSPPTLDEVKTYCQDKKFIIDTDYFFEFYTTAKWLNSGGKKIKNWKLTALTWNNREIKNGQSRTNQPRTVQRKQTAAERLRAKARQM